MDTLLSVRDLRVSFASDQGRIEAVSGVSIDVPSQKSVCIVGESGCGKTVTALSILRLIPDPPGRIDGGEIVFDGENLLEFSERRLRDVRGNRISMIFQEPVSSLNPVFTVGDQIREALSAHSKVPKSEERDRVLELLTLVKIPGAESRYDAYPHELSGGMCQRVMIAIALACEPQLLIADEPTTALDVTIQAGILDLLLELKDELGMSVLLITHDLGIVAEFADDVYVMYAGKIVEHASCDVLFSEPRHPYTVGLLNSIPTMEDKRKAKLNAIDGFVPSLADLPRGCRFQDRCPLVFDKCTEAEPSLDSVGPLHYSACFRSALLSKSASGGGS